ncbi:OmpA family protein [uncultured Shewanella sp.]|uniref:OmpA family protein n=1 Tax=uncultured Shewanella sp. TaxID=173975 RepID=UPI00263752CA|nr:OmpA family protein [uncultured Shewanella sp.]
MLIIRMMIICLLFNSSIVLASKYNLQYWKDSIDPLGIGTGYRYVFNSQFVETESFDNIISDFLCYNYCQLNIGVIITQLEFPVSGYLVNTVQPSRMMVTFKTGMAYSLISRLSLGFRYDFDAKVIDSNFASEDNIAVIKNHGSASALFKIRYLFTDKNQKQIISLSIYTNRLIQSSSNSLTKFTVYFDSHYSTASQANQALVVEIKKLAAINQDCQISIQGHRNAQGAKAYNLMLSEQGALSAKNLLLAQGISVDPIDISFQRKMIQFQIITRRYGGRVTVVS